MWNNNQVVLFNLGPGTAGNASSFRQFSIISLLFWWKSPASLKGNYILSPPALFMLRGPAISWPRWQVTQVSHKDAHSCDSESWGEWCMIGKMVGTHILTPTRPSSGLHSPCTLLPRALLWSFPEPGPQPSPSLPSVLWQVTFLLKLPSVQGKEVNTRLSNFLRAGALSI